MAPSYSPITSCSKPGVPACSSQMKQCPCSVSPTVIQSIGIRATIATDSIRGLPSARRTDAALRDGATQDSGNNPPPPGEAQVKLPLAQIRARIGAETLIRLPGHVSPASAIATLTPPKVAVT